MTQQLYPNYGRIYRRNSTISVAPSIKLLDWLLRLRRPTHQLTFAEIEAREAKRLNAFTVWLIQGAKIAMAQIENRDIPGRHGAIPLRIYTPHQRRPLPPIVFFHGGGWVTGSLDSHDALCRQIAHRCDTTVIAVAYRLSPRYRFPIPLEDCFDATCWVAQQAEQFTDSLRNNVIVMGDSAGGNLATGVCRMLKNGITTLGDRPPLATTALPVIRQQILIYPCTDGTLSQPSHQRHANAPILTRRGIEFFRDAYARTPDDILNSYFSPLLADDLQNLPPALILTAEYDPLRDEGAAYARKLAAAGVPVQFKDYQGLIHAFLSFPRFCPGSGQALDEVSNYVQAGRVKED